MLVARYELDVVPHEHGGKDAVYIKSVSYINIPDFLINGGFENMGEEVEC